jgi:hypothetical protein
MVLVVIEFVQDAMTGGVLSLGDVTCEAGYLGWRF